MTNRAKANRYEHRMMMQGGGYAKPDSRLTNAEWEAKYELRAEYYRKPARPAAAPAVKVAKPATVANKIGTVQAKTFSGIMVTADVIDMLDGRYKVVINDKKATVLTSLDAVVNNYGEITN